MAVRIRLKRRGRKKLARYDIVVADARAPRDGRFIEKLGNYEPVHKESRVKLDGDRALFWLLKGAQPTDTVRNLLSNEGVMLKKHLQVGVLKQAITQEDADKKMSAWRKEQEKQKEKNAIKLKKVPDTPKATTQKVQPNPKSSEPKVKKTTQETVKSPKDTKKSSMDEKSVVQPASSADAAKLKDTKKGPMSQKPVASSAPSAEVEKTADSKTKDDSPEKSP